MIVILSKQSVDPFKENKNIFEHLKSLFHYGQSTTEILHIIGNVLDKENVQNFIDSQFITSLSQYISTDKDTVYRIYDFLIKDYLKYFSS